LAAYFVLLHRYTGQSDIVVGTPIANRGRVELEQLIGYFVNTLPIRVSFGKHLTFYDLVTWLRSYLIEVYEHQELPFDKIVSKLVTDRSKNRNPIFQVCFQCHKAFIRLPQVAGLEFSHIHIDRHGTPLDLNFAMIDRDGHWRLSAEYVTGVYDETTVDRMLGHYQTLLEGITSNPNERIYNLPLLTRQERSQLLSEWNETKREYPSHQCVDQLFEIQAIATPQAIAVVFEDQRLTYRELNERANQLANHLRNLGVKPDTFVGLFVDRSLEMVVGLLGILKAGGAYMPMDPLHPQQRLASMLADAQPLVILTQERLQNQVPPHQAHVICLDSHWIRISRELTTPPAHLNQPPDLAYVIYTSGSTGKPKGVQISHRALVNFLISMQSQPGIDRGDVLLAVTTLSFDIAGLEIFLPLITGARVVIAPVEVMLDGVALARLIKDSRVTVMQATPATWRLLLESGWAGDTKLKVLCGGEAWPASLADELLSRCRSLWNMYGPTETTIWSATMPIARGQPVLLGRPIANTQFYILGQALQPVPIGVAGELHIGGDGLARGYLNRPELNVDKFIPNPFGNAPGARLYKTGDLCRYRADGNIEYLGRMDQQVKIRGFRIELGEIESVLAKHPNILNVVAAAREDVPGNKTIVAYLVLRQKPAPTTAELRALLTQILPDYMVPGVYITLPSLPLTPNGKIDRNALPAPDKNRLDQVVRFEAPSTSAEVALTKIWCKLLGVEQVGIHENFFAIGGNSLLAIRMIHEIKRQIAPNMPVRMPFQFPTIQELAKALLTQKLAERKPELIQLQAGNRAPEVFLIIDGDSVGLFKLSRFMDKELRLYASVVPLPEAALKASAKKQFSELPRMEDLAAYHVALIKNHQTTGPIVLVGHCFAGKLAFEVAHQLQAIGMRVDAVLMLDTWMTRPSLWLRKTAWLREHVGNLLQQGPLYLWNKFQQRIRERKSDLAARLELGIRKDFNVQMPRSIIDRINRHAGLGYQLKPLASRGILFLSQDDWLTNAYRPLDDSLGTRGLFTGGLQVINVPGNHVTVLDERHLAIAAGQFNKCIGQFR
jgi:amino acid adenylation domain-containing protein